jgi:hypothetical protein
LKRLGSQNNHAAFYQIREEKKVPAAPRETFHKNSLITDTIQFFSISVMLLEKRMVMDVFLMPFRSDYVQGTAPLSDSTFTNEN